VITRAHKRRLNQALHELRRPLQALTLLEEDGPRIASSSAESRRGLIELVSSALTDVDRAVNGGGPAPATRRVSCRELVLACLERWRPAAAPVGGFRVFWDAGPAVVEGDPARLAQALDNLIVNALEHGGPPLVVTGASVAGRVRITVANGRAPSYDGEAFEASNGHGPTGRRDLRRGHGTKVVSEFASAHRGRFALCETGEGCVAALELPLADSRYARAA
jgi:signal transduction histidine kinase